jgi:UDP-glucose 4-epimerase
MNILLTGGLGFIGSHTASALLGRGFNPILLDNLCNSQPSTLDRLEQIAEKRLVFYDVDVRDKNAVHRVLKEQQIHAVMHFAGLKSVAESESEPLKYYDNNVTGTISLVQVMQEAGLRKFIFSSSATVYGIPQYLPYDENHPTMPINTYGRTKLQVEHILRDLAQSDPSWSIACLRYFNPVGAHESGLIGELPKGIPNNLMPYVCQVASGKLPYFKIFGDDYETPDGTGQRDYIHVMDLAEGHIATLQFLEAQSGCHFINLGTGVPYSVRQLLAAFEKTIDRAIDQQIEARRRGDLPVYYATADKAKALLGWEANRSLQSMCDSAWNFHQKSMHANGR